jgi:hypothetical protein
MNFKEQRFTQFQKEQMPFFSPCARFQSGNIIFEKDNALAFLHLREKVFFFKYLSKRVVQGRKPLIS